MNHSIRTQAMTSGTLMPPGGLPPLLDACAFRAGDAGGRAGQRVPSQAVPLASEDESGEGLVAEVQKEAVRYCW